MNYKYRVLFEKNEIALIERGKKQPEYAVVSGLVQESERRYEGDDWNWTVGYASHDAVGLSSMLDLFRAKTENAYISRVRLEELATRLKKEVVNICLYDCAASDEEIMDIFDKMNLEEYEKDFFGIKNDEIF